MSRVYTYDPSQVKLNIAGYIITGMMDVTVSPNKPAFTIKQGIRGRNTRVNSRDTSAELTISILQTSISNDILSAIVESDRQLMTGRLEVSLTDASGTTFVASDEAFVESIPSAQFGREMQNRSWKICMLSTKGAIIGGNFKPAVNLF